MRPRHLLAVLLLVFLWAPMVSAQDLEGGGIVYGSEIGALVSAPKGWIFDSQSGVSQGLHAVMYPAGSAWANAKVMMYVSFAKNNDGTLEAFITGDVEQFKKNSPNITAEKADPIAMKGSASAEVRLFSGDKWGNYECVAYVSKDKSVAIYVLSAKTKEDMLKNLDAFRTMVEKSALMAVKFR